MLLEMATQILLGMTQLYSSLFPEGATENYFFVLIGDAIRMMDNVYASEYGVDVVNVRSYCLAALSGRMIRSWRRVRI